MATAQRDTAQRCAPLRLRELDALAPHFAYSCDNRPSTMRPTFTITSNPTSLFLYIGGCAYYVIDTFTRPCWPGTMLCHSLLFHCVGTLLVRPLATYCCCENLFLEFYFIFRLKFLSCYFCYYLSSVSLSLSLVSSGRLKLIIIIRVR